MLELFPCFLPEPPLPPEPLEDLEDAEREDDFFLEEDEEEVFVVDDDVEEAEGDVGVFGLGEVNNEPREAPREAPIEDVRVAGLLGDFDPGAGGADGPDDDKVIPSIEETLSMRLNEE